MATKNEKFLSLSILILSLASQIHCDPDKLIFNKIGCLFIDQLKMRDTIITFDFYEGYYRAIHASYNYYESKSVILRYLGDSSKDIFVSCLISPNNRELITQSTFHYFIPCILERPYVELNEGTYCVELVKSLMGDIDSWSFCSNSLSFKAIKSTNIPGFTVRGFSSDQSGCVHQGETITLLATVSNQMSMTQDYDNIGIGLANTEVIADDIPLQCRIEGQKSVGSTDKIICQIPYYISEGYYNVFYSSNLTGSYECPANVINKFNSNNFEGQVKKLYIYRGGNNENIESTLMNISFENPSGIPGLFNLTFSLNNIMNYNYFTFENFKNKNNEIKLCDKLRGLIDTKCDFIKSSDSASIFYLICTPVSFEQEISYSLVILSEITIGSDTSEVVCTYGSYKLYKKIIIPSNEYDFLILYDENNSPYLDCNVNNKGFYHYTVSKVTNYCGSCNYNCLTCPIINTCSQCQEGTIVKNSRECSIIKEKINYTNFQEYTAYYPHEDSCRNSKEDLQLFSLVYPYIITKGGNLAIESESYNNNVYATNGNRNYGLNCIIDVNPTYFGGDEKPFGYCKQPFCTLYAYVNCSFHEQISNGDYEIKVNSNNDFGKLLDQAISQIRNNKITFNYNKLIATIMKDSIKIAFKGKIYIYPDVYLCPNINSQFEECYPLTYCQHISIEDEETVFNCTKTIEDYDESYCQTFTRIMMKDQCGKYINESFDFKFCPPSDDSYDYSSESASAYLGNLFMLLIILLIFF